MTDYIIPGLLLALSALALGQRKNYYDWLLEGAAQGLGLIKTVLPSLVLLLTAVHMFRASGASGLLSHLLSPVFSRFGIPPECAGLVLIRPISGSAALAVGGELMAHYGVDSLVGRTAAVMLGSRYFQNPLYPPRRAVCRLRWLPRRLLECAIFIRRLAL